MENWKKALVVVAFMATIGGLVATQYASMKASVKVTLDAKGAYVTFAGIDKGATYYVLENNTFNYTLNLGVWCDNTTKIYTAAFMVVNRESIPIYLYKADFAAPSGVSVYLWAHTNASNLPEAFGGISAQDTGGWVYNLTDTTQTKAWKIAASPVAYDRNSVSVRLYNLTGTGASTDSALTWTQSGTGYIWALTSFASAADGTLFDGAKPGYSNAVFIYVKVVITNQNAAFQSAPYNMYASLTLYFSESAPSGYTVISA